MPSGEPGLWGRKALTRGKITQLCRRNRRPVSPAPRWERPLWEAPPNFRSQAGLGDLTSAEVTPPVSVCAHAGFWSLIPDLIHSTNIERRLCVRLSALGVQLRPKQAWSFLSQGLPTIGKKHNKQDLAGTYLLGVVQDISRRGEV